MKIFLNQDSVKQLEALMVRTGYTNPTHCINVMISTITNNLRKADTKKKNNKHLTTINPNTSPQVKGSTYRTKGIEH